MIEWVRLRNFQIHEDRLFALAPVTSVVGPTGSGKSSLVRALHWLLFNQPDGLDFLRHDADEVTVSALIDSKILSRSRSKKHNTYEFDGKTYHALGRGGVPDPIRDFLSADRINFSKQADPYFWFSSSQTDVSRALNEVLDLSLIDQSLDFASRSVKSSRDSLQDAQNRSRTHQEAIQTLGWTDTAFNDLNALESVLGALAEVRGRIEILEGWLVEWEGLEGLVGEVPDLSEWEMVVAEGEGVGKRIGVFERWLEEWERNEQDLARREREWQELEAELRKTAEACPECGRPFP